MANKLSRRGFLKTSATGAVAAAAMVGGVPYVIGAEKARKKIRFANIGCGGRGGAHLRPADQGGGCIKALCDVDARAVNNAAKARPNAKKYSDYRKMFEDMADEIDAVVVATPDHSHYPAAMRALKLGKHVYCEKPLTWGVWEAQQLAAEAAKQKVATQMGNQGSSGEGWRLIYEYIAAGSIGTVKEVHTWTNRPIWPQGIGRPEGQDEVPEGLNWDVWIGPAPMRPFKGRAEYDRGRRGPYHGFNWRGWIDFGSGALGDMACHTQNAMYKVMEPTAPLSIEPIFNSGINSETFPKSSTIKCVFPKTAKRAGFTSFWYDGGRFPPRPEGLEEGRTLQRAARTGTMFVGTKGTLLSKGDYNSHPTLLPLSAHRAFGKPARLFEERSNNHFGEFLAACRREIDWDKTKSHFGFAGPMAANVLLGNVALIAGKKLEMNPDFTFKKKEYNKLLKRTPRKGFEA